MIYKYKDGTIITELDKYCYMYLIYCEVNKLTYSHNVLLDYHLSKLYNKKITKTSNVYILNDLKHLYHLNYLSDNWVINDNVRHEINYTKNIMHTFITDIHKLFNEHTEYVLEFNHADIPNLE